MYQNEVIYYTKYDIIVSLKTKNLVSEQSSIVMQKKYKQNTSYPTYIWRTDFQWFSSPFCQITFGHPSCFTPWKTLTAKRQPEMFTSKWKGRDHLNQTFMTLGSKLHFLPYGS